MSRRPLETAMNTWNTFQAPASAPCPGARPGSGRRARLAPLHEAGAGRQRRRFANATPCRTPRAKRARGLKRRPAPPAEDAAPFPPGASHPDQSLRLEDPAKPDGHAPSGQPQGRPPQRRPPQRNGPTRNQARPAPGLEGAASPPPNGVMRTQTRNLRFYTIFACATKAA